MVVDIAKQSLMYDFYGTLLTERQQEVLDRYYGENFSLSEIAEEFRISRQGVHDTLKNADKALEDYENKLGLVKKFQKRNKILNHMNNKLYEESLNQEIKIKIAKKFVKDLMEID